MENMNELKLLTDEALGEGNDISLDGLGFSTYANIIKSASLGSDGPFTIGIFGEWGTGKTSLMRMIKEGLSSESGVTTIWFNAWRFEKEEHPIIPLIATIVNEIQNHKSFLSRFKDGGNSLVEALRAVAYGFSAKAKVKIPGLAEVEASFAAKDMIERDSSFKSDPLLDHSLYYKSFEKLSSVRFPDSAKVVVIIDDLDRCFPNLAIKLLESIKLILSQRGFIFILGVARSIIEGYLKFQYQTRFGIVNFHGQEYLDKIVQLPFYIPPHRGRMKDFSSKILDRIDTRYKLQIESVMPIIFSASSGNPRSTIRFVNNLLIDAAIYRELEKLGKISEISIQYFAVSRCLQSRWPQVFKILIDSDDICHAISEWNPKNLRGEISSDNEATANLAAILLNDKDLKFLLYSEAGKLWLKNHRARRSTLDFLETQRIGENAYFGDQYNYDILFIYSADDTDEVSNVADDLMKCGLRIFMADKYPYEESFDEYIVRAVQNSKVLAVFLGRNYNKCLLGANNNSGVLCDFKYIIEKFKSKDDFVEIIPIILPGFRNSLLPDEVKNCNAIDLRTNTGKNNLKSLAKALQNT